MSILAVLFILVPFLFWQQTWFGRRLTDGELSRYLNDSGQSRRIQHALVQVSERMAAGDPEARQWYPGLLRAARNPNAAIRNTAAWAMGQDPRSDALHQGLVPLLSDPDVQVRRNAALALVRFGDASGRTELINILKGHDIRTTAGGSLQLLVKAGQQVGAGTRVATLRSETGEEQPTAPFHARVGSVLAPDGARVQPGAALLTLAPQPDDVWESLRGLYFIGETGDLPDIERYARGLPEMPDRIARQAALTAQAIRTRLGPNSNR
jgi:hypothetical protein